jgi:diacylglycerol kinase (ATP)
MIIKEIKRLYKAFFYSVDGLTEAFKTEPAFRIEILIAVILIPLALFLDITNVEQCLMIGSILLVIIVELINSGIEAIVDRISKEKHPLSKKAKDVGSAAVLVSALNAVVIWALVLI